MATKKPTKPKRARFTVELPEPLMRQFAAFTGNEGITKKAAIEDAVSLYLSKFRKA